MVKSFGDLVLFHIITVDVRDQARSHLSLRVMVLQSKRHRDFGNLVRLRNVHVSQRILRKGQQSKCRLTHPTMISRLRSSAPLTTHQNFERVTVLEKFADEGRYSLLQLRTFQLQLNLSDHNILLKDKNKTNTKPATGRETPQTIRLHLLKPAREREEGWSESNSEPRPELSNSGSTVNFVCCLFTVESES